MRPPRNLALLAAGALAGCGATATPARISGADRAQALAGSPAPLARLHGQAGQLLPGGPVAFRRALRALRGYPVVVNKWASWCGPCRSEFPAFQEASVRLGRRVAFLGLNGHGDAPAAAAAFLKTFPVAYPTFLDENEDIARTIEASTYDPLTVYIDRAGRITYVHPGSYTSTATLERDVMRYALR